MAARALACAPARALVPSAVTVASAASEEDRGGSVHLGTVPAHLTSQTLLRGFAPTARWAYPTGFVGARFLRCASKSWADGLRPLYPPTVPRRPLFAQGLRPYGPVGLPRGLCRGSISPLRFEIVGGWASPIVSAHRPSAPAVCTGASPLRPGGPTPRALSGLDFSAALRNGGRMGFAHCIRPPSLGARPIAERWGPRIAERWGPRQVVGAAAGRRVLVCVNNGCSPSRKLLGRLADTKRDDKGVGARGRSPRTEGAQTGKSGARRGGPGSLCAPRSPP